MYFTVFEKLADRMTDKGIIDQDVRELYVYGLQQGFVLIANIVTTLLIGWLLNMFVASIIFMLTYMPLRSFAGGYHARTQLQCYLFGMVMTSAVLMGAKMIPWTPLMCLGIALISGLVVFLLAPVEDENKPLDEQEVSQYKKRARGILLIEWGVIGLTIGLGAIELAGAIVISLAALAAMLLLGHGRNVKLARNHRS